MRSGAPRFSIPAMNGLPTTSVARTRSSPIRPRQSANTVDTCPSRQRDAKRLTCAIACAASCRSPRNVARPMCRWHFDLASHCSTMAATRPPFARSTMSCVMRRRPTRVTSTAGWHAPPADHARRRFSTSNGIARMRRWSTIAWKLDVRSRCFAGRCTAPAWPPPARSFRDSVNSTRAARCAASWCSLPSVALRDLPSRSKRRPPPCRTSIRTVRRRRTPAPRNNGRISPPAWARQRPSPCSARSTP